MNFNIAPYFDDFNEDKGYYQVLFQPKYGVQVRELNNLQSILQNQISRFGQNIFQEGSMVVPGNITYNNQYAYVQLQSAYNGVSASSIIANLVGQSVIGKTSGVTAQVVNYYIPSAGNVTLYVQYTTAGASGSVFQDNELIAPTSANLSNLVVQAIPSGSTGFGSAFSIARGIYFVRGYFAIVEPQTIFLDPYGTQPNCTVGFLVQENVVTWQQDTSLLDNAQGEPNYSAPGANRYQIVLTLTQVPSGQPLPTNFVQLTTYVAGAQQGPVNTSTYSIIADTLARRTYDQAGNYTTTPFSLAISDYRNNNRGQWASGMSVISGDVVQSGQNYYTALKSGTTGSVPPTFVNSIGSDGTVVWMHTLVPYFNKATTYTPAATETTTQSTSGDSLMVATVSAGKAYVDGYELEKTAKTNVVIPKPRTTVQQDQQVINTECDNYILITGLNGLFDFTTIPVVNLYDAINTTPGTANGNLLGTCRVFNVSLYSGTPGTATAIYRASIGDIKLSNPATNFNRQVKQLAYNNGNSTFTASISPVLTLLNGSVSASSSTTLTGNGTLFLTQVQVGDWLYFDVNTKAQVVSIQSNVQLTVASAITVNAEAPQLMTTQIVGSGNNSLAFLLAHPFVASARNEFGQITTSYTAIQKFTGTFNSSGALVVSVNNTTTDTFAPTTNQANYIVYDTTANAIVNPISLTLNGPLQQLTVTASSALNGHSAIIFAAVNRTGAGTEKTKTLTNGTLTITNQTAATVSQIYLGEADGYNLLRVMMDSGGFSAPTGQYTIDITSNYTFNDGQTPQYYGPASISLAPSASAPTGPIQISWTYFAHSSSGDYFTVNSYLGTIGYRYIPSYAGVMLTDVIDFRSRWDNPGAAPSVVNAFPAVGYDASISYSNYQGRFDIIDLDKNGNFNDIQGTPSYNPKFPQVPSGAMGMFEFKLPPFLATANSSTVGYDKIDNSVYTMKDIAELDSRITNLEYYTSLSLLEQSTLNLPLTDSAGNNLYKNGIATDSFNGKNSLADVSNPDYICSQDPTNSRLLPFYTMDSVQLIESNSSASARQSAGYAVNNNILTLSYGTENYIQQPFGTDTVNLNPFAIYKFVGSLKLTPSSDNWFETQYVPSVVTKVVDDYTTMNTLLKASGVLGTQWNAWQTTWSGVVSSSSSTSQAQRTGQYYVVNAGTTNSGNIGLVGITQNFGYAGGIQNYYGISLANSTAQNVNVTGAEASQIWNQNYANGHWVHGTFAQTQTVTSWSQTTQYNQTRTGVQTTYVPQTTNTVNGVVTLAQTAIPYMRQRNIQFYCGGMKPQTPYYVFMGGSNITNYVTPAQRIVFTAIANQSSTFDYKTNVGASGASAARSIPNDSVEVLNVGDVITGGTSGATAVVVGQEWNIIAQQNELYVVNILGTFIPGEQITGSISNAIVNVVSVDSPLKSGNAVLPTTNGNIYGLILIPNNSSISFQCGTDNIVFTDNSTTNDTSQAKSFAVAVYTADGVLNTDQKNLTATTTGNIVQTNVSQNQTIYNTVSGEYVSGTGYQFLGYDDPVSQSFLVPDNTGIFITGIDLFFASVDPSIPVNVRLVTMDNGYPASTIVPNSSVIVPPSAITTSQNGTAATHVTFPSPVYLNGNTEYAVQLISQSNAYNIYVATLGKQDLATGVFVSQSPYAGVLFESKNSTTWQANMNSTLKFTLYRAVFSTAASTVNFQNAYPTLTQLPINPFSTTSGSNVVGVTMISHGLSNGSYVTINNAVAGNGLPALNGNYVVSNCTLDSFTITAPTAATFTGNFGGSGVIAFGNTQYDTGMIDVQDIIFPGTSVQYQVSGTSGKSIDGSESPYLADNKWIAVQNSVNYSVSSPKLVASQINSLNLMGGAASYFMEATLQTNSDKISPIIDISRCSVTLVQNKVNFPAVNNETVPVGSSTYSKYVTKPITLANPANNLHIMLGENVYPGGQILVYYKVGTQSQSQNIQTQNWVLANPDSTVPLSSGNSFIDVSYTITGLPSFDLFMVKIVLQSTNEATPPSASSLRIIATV
jgi:hypothetical protein